MVYITMNSLFKFGPVELKAHYIKVKIFPETY